jgi:hypothetical protein
VELSSPYMGFNLAWAAPFRPDPIAKLGDLPFPMRASNTFNYLSIRIPTLKCIHYAWDAQGLVRQSLRPLASSPRL